MLLEYQLDWIKIVDFLLIAKFWASPDNYCSLGSTIRNQSTSDIHEIFTNWALMVSQRGSAVS